MGTYASRIVVVCILVHLWPCAIATAATIYVPDDYSTIQEAINASVNGDTVIVRPGTYYGYISFGSKAITVKSEQGPHLTTIDGNQYASVVYFGWGAGNDSVLDGFTVTNGVGTWISGIHDYYGGGIFCESSTPTIINNIIKNNIVDNSYGGGGGGIYSLDGSPVIVGNIISENSPEGILCTTFYGPSASPVIQYNTISGNDGCGIVCVDTPLITNNRIIGNADSGILCSFGSATVVNNFISTNSARYGGGFFGGNWLTALLVNNTICSNSASISGGGICCSTRCIITVSNTILWGNDALENGPEIALFSGTTLTINHSDVKGGQNSVYKSNSSLNWGAGMIQTDPLFAETANNDFHLTWNSPCRDTGDNSVVTELYDAEGDPRIAFGTVDMGADEFYYHLYRRGEVSPGSSISLRVVGYPNAPVLLAYSPGIQNPPLSTQHGDLWLQWPPLWQGNIGTVPGDGILTISPTVPTTWTPGSEHYLQSLIGPWNGPYSRLSNLLTLTVE